MYTAVQVAYLARKEQLAVLRTHLLEKSTVHTHNMDENWIANYINTGQPFGKAGGLCVNSLEGQEFVSYIDGCFYNVKGFPFDKFIPKFKMLIEMAKTDPTI